jgi:hypothetical protein
MAEEIKSEILDLENQYWNAIKENDKATLTKLTADPCIVTGAQGAARLDKKTFEKMMNEPNWTLLDYEIENAEVQPLGKDVAVIGYRVHEVVRYEGEELKLDAADASTWVKKNGSWVCALHTESLLGDPFGRDRRIEH